ncbi:MAG: FTR1 family protein [Candidatus Bathyarchaeota archaeon]|nr:FTR1 family protein [Candidatus Bathyarchaeota archaeon]
MIASFLIAFRESLEAALIVSVILAYLGKIGRKDLQRYLYLGTGLAIVVSLGIGWGVITFYGSLSKNAERIFEGFASITATMVLTYMIFWMSRNARKIKSELQEKIDVAVTTGYLFGITALAFVAVFREGLETVLFLTALAIADPLATFGGTILGIGSVLLLSLLMMRGIYQMNIQKFFKYTSIILVFFGAGLLGYGVHEFIEAGWLPAIIDHVWDINPANPTHPLHENGVIGSILKALIGYDGNPELLRVIVYVGYWVVIGLYLLKIYAPEYLNLKRSNNKDGVKDEVEQTNI